MRKIELGKWQNTCFTIWLLTLITVCATTLFLTFQAFIPCLPDSPDRFYMGRGSNQQCLYQDMNTGEIYEVK